jgi:hypothetical protein
VEVHLSVALVRMTGKFVNSMTHAVPAILELPTTQETTVSSATVFLPGGKVIDTMVIDSAETAGLKADTGMLSAIKKYRPSEGTSYNPRTFRVPIESIPARSEVSFDVAYFENMRFAKGEYFLKVPLHMDPPSVIEGGPSNLAEVLSITVDMNTGTPEASKGSKISGHALTFVSGADSLSAPDGMVKTGAGIPARFQLALKPGVPVPNEDFVISYTAWTSRILANSLMERLEPSPSGEERGVMALFLSPPRRDVIGAATFPRHLVFLLDNSGSMSGSPMRVAKEALKSCLKELAPADKFSICVFNHRRLWWRGEAIYDKYTQEEGTIPGKPSGHVVFPASSDVVARAMAFVSTIETSGMTDILTPVQQAHELLEDPTPSSTKDWHTPVAAPVSSYPGTSFPGAPVASYPGSAPPPTAPPPEASSGPAPVPIVFLITDGAVSGERAIVANLRDAVNASAGSGRMGTRMFTFGIGQYVNDHFLRMAAQVGRGHYGSALRLDTLEEDIVALMEKSSAPVLTDLAVGVKGVTSFECFPFPLPDLFCGAPIVVSARYTGTHPTQVFIRGRMPNGAWTEWSCPVLATSHVPVAKVFARKQLDILIAKHWLLGADSGDAVAEEDASGRLSHEQIAELARMRAEIIDISTSQQVPCPYTTMVGFSTTNEEYTTRHKAQEEEDRARRAGESKTAPASAAAHTGAPKTAGKGMSTGTKVALGAGAVVALGATVAAGAALGSIVASGTGVGGLVTGAVNVAGDAGGAIGAGLAGLGNLAGGAANAVANCDCFGIDCGACGGLPGFLDGCFGDCGTCMGDVVRCVPDTLGGCIGGCGTCLSGDICAGLGGCAEGVFGNCGTCLAGVGECVGNGCGGFSEVLGGCGQLAGGCGQAVCSVAGGAANCVGNIGPCIGGMGDCIGAVASVFN